MLKEREERLSKTEYDKIGDMLLELMGDCPYIPKDSKGQKIKIKYNSKDVGKCVCIFTTGGNIKSKNVLGGFTAELTMQIAYKSSPQGNGAMIDAQNVLEKITGWLRDFENFPRLTGGRKITDITTGASFPTIDDVEGDNATVYASNVVMEYEVD